MQTLQTLQWASKTGLLQCSKFNSAQQPFQPASFAIRSNRQPMTHIRPAAVKEISSNPLGSVFSTALLKEAWSRGRWLLGLLVLQSTSSFVLERYQQLLKDHIVITLYLTMLIGAGGNAGNQSAIKVIRGLATGTIKATGSSIRKTISQQALVGLLLGGGLSIGGFVRVYITNGNLWNSLAISLSLLLIVMTSVVAGTALPFGLARLQIDPANAGTSIQVVMDIMGVLLTCLTCQFILEQLAAGVTAS